MAALRVAFARLLGLFGREAREGRLAHEVIDHLEALEAEHRARGLPDDEAALAARKQFGGVAQMTEAHRDQAALPRRDASWQEAGVAVRRIWHEPSFSASATGEPGKTPQVPVSTFLPPLGRS